MGGRPVFWLPCVWLAESGAMNVSVKREKKQVRTVCLVRSNLILTLGALVLPS